jgi:hypothetical protein
VAIDNFRSLCLDARVGPEAEPRGRAVLALAGGIGEVLASILAAGEHGQSRELAERAGFHGV